MLRLVIIVGFFVIGAIVGVWLTSLANEELLDKQKIWRLSSPMLDENNYTAKGKVLRRRANRFVNTYLLGFLLYFVFASHVLSCHQT
jgi:hypothetical protein